MRRATTGFLSALVALSLGACQRDDSAVMAKLDELAKGQEALKEQLAKGGGAGARRPQRPARPRPKPNDVYSVNIAGAAYKGAEHAKVTVVEAFEFA